MTPNVCDSEEERTDGDTYSIKVYYNKGESTGK